MSNDKNYSPMLHGAALDKLPPIIGKKGIIDSYTRKLHIKGEGIELYGIEKPFRISTHKLLCAAVICFTAVDHTGSKDHKIQNREVSMTLHKYAAMLGMPVTDSTLKNLRKKVKRDLALLESSKLTWMENVSGETESHNGVAVADSADIKHGVIVITLSERFVGWLTRRPIMQYPAMLLKLDERNAVAYRLGYKMVCHGSNSNNVRKGTAGTLTFRTLYRYSGLPDIESLSAKDQSYTHHIITPFCRALDTLVECNVLAGYSFRSTDTAKSFVEWLDKRIDFELAKT